MHTLLVFISVLLCFSHHVPAASSNDRGLGEPHGHHHIDLDGRKIQSKRFDDGSWDPGKYPQDNDGTQSPAQPPIEASNEKPKKEEPEGEKPEKPEEKNDDNKDDKKGCRRLEKQYIFYEPLKGAVEKFCEEANGQDRDENTGGFDLTYYGGTPDEVIIGIDWETDDKPNKDDCLEELMQLVDKCSPKGDDNPYNAKAGGKRDAGVFAYRIDPQKERHAYNGAAKAKCMCDKKRANIDCYIWGRGWGVDGKELKKHLMECDPVESPGPLIGLRIIQLTSRRTCSGGQTTRGKSRLHTLLIPSGSGRQWHSLLFARMPDASTMPWKPHRRQPTRTASASVAGC